MAGVAFLALAVLPLAEIVSRRFFQSGIPGSGPFVQHLTLWVAFLGAALAAREGRLLRLSIGDLFPEGDWKRKTEILSAAVGGGVSLILARASFDLVWIERQSETIVAVGVPVWVAQLVLPVAFVAIAFRLVWRASDAWLGRCLAGLGLLVGALLGQYPGWLEARPAWPGLLIVVAATLVGSPIFAALGGAAALLFMAEGVPLAAVPAETYRLAVSPTLPAIPLFTLAGFLLSEGGASKRLLRVFRAFFGWIPGGNAVVCAVTCAFFTVLTGGSGVTILALGGLLLPALLADGYRERFSLGMLTASGSLGLLFPPALPLILYGIVAEISIEDLFVGGLVPGILMVVLLAGWGVREGWVTGAGRVGFSWHEALAASRGALWELALPALVLTAVFGGFATLVEASALTVAYAFFVQTVVHRDIGVRRDLPRILTQCLVLVGGVLIILGVAMGLTSYMVDAFIPARLLEWTRANIESPLVFLLALNAFLLVVGCLMDIFSAIVVVVPLIVPIGLEFGVHPIHLGIIFVANLELGYLTPPVGMNLFLASYRFEKPLLEVYRSVLPFLALRTAGVLAVTYLPWLSLGLLEYLGR